MNRIVMPFGKKEIELTTNRQIDIILPIEKEGVKNELEAIIKAMKTPLGCKPLHMIAKGKNSVAIVINDLTRPVPTESMLTAIIEELYIAKIDIDEIRVIVALGNHEKQSDLELKEMLGRWYGKLKVISHDCYNNSELKYVGETPRGMPVYVNKYYAEAELKILTGMITPHQSAGFSGGRKSIVPGIAGIETLKKHHSFPIRPKNPVLGVIKNNPFHEEAVAAARLVGSDFIVNVIKNYKNEVVSVVTGDLEVAHNKGVELCRESWIRKVKHKYDITIVSPGRYPKDIDLHQSQKALAVGEQITNMGGTIILVAECSHGIGKFGNILKNANSVDDVIDRFTKNGFSPDHSSKAYMIARAIKKHRVIMVTNGITSKELQEMFIEKASTLEGALKMALCNDNSKSILCIPYAGECIPVLAEHE